jgi:uncharacterized membrane protein AbrB (regulator of aidB expression)
MQPENAGRLMLTLGVAVAGGLLLSQVGIPAGAMIGSMLATAVLGISTGKVFFPVRFRPVIQISVGAFLGARMTYDSLLSLQVMSIAGIMRWACWLHHLIGYLSTDHWIVSPTCSWPAHGWSG